MEKFQVVGGMWRFISLSLSRGRSNFPIIPTNSSLLNFGFRFGDYPLNGIWNGLVENCSVICEIALQCIPLNGIWNGLVENCSVIGEIVLQCICASSGIQKKILSLSDQDLHHVSPQAIPPDGRVWRGRMAWGVQI